MSWRSRRRPAGFTLLEMLIVLAVMALTLTLFLDRGPPASPALRTRTAAAEVAAALRQARGQAIAGAEPVLLAVDPLQGTYRVGAGRVRHLPPGVAIAALWGEGARRRPIAGIRFGPEGDTSGGRIELAAGSAQARIDVDWLTGRLAVRDD
jgi:general secretion pathway protein H